MSRHFQYFAYGSNMSSPRLQARTPSASKLLTARLPGHRLAFHKVGRDASAKCDIVDSTHDDSHVLGVVFLIAAHERPALDRAEGVGNGYRAIMVNVEAHDGSRLSALAYQATRIDASLMPYDWYLHHVIFGAREHDLPDDYVAMLQAVKTIRDEDHRRAAAERMIYPQD
jgi:cation transport regulator ChaC